LEAITKSPRAPRESPILPRAYSASAGPIPRSAPYAQRSGSGPKRALKAITKTPRAKRESLILPRAFLRAQDRSRGAPHTPSGAGSVRSKPWRRSPKSPAHRAKAQSFPEPPQRAQDRSRGAPQARPAERDRSAASLGSDHQNPQRTARKSKPYQSLLSARRTVPAEPSSHPALTPASARHPSNL
jgi:hypothetical protein